jgi:hypothetical protein
MNYLDAKTVLMQNTRRQIPFRLFAFEAAALVGLAASLVLFFA